MLTWNLVGSSAAIFFDPSTLTRYSTSVALNMDGTTEPLLTVIGNPIAGNPSQFALERAIAALGARWRVLSFDVAPEDIAAALNGFAVTGICGVLIDPSVSHAASLWHAEQTGNEGQLVDCLVRSDDGRFIGSDERLLWIEQQFASRAGVEGLYFGHGGKSSSWNAAALGLKKISGHMSAETIESARTILVVDDLSGPPELEVDEWPEDDGSTLVIDLSTQHPMQLRIKELGYEVVSHIDLQIGVLERALEKWTQMKVDSAVIRDAVEEYLGV